MKSKRLIITALLLSCLSCPSEIEARNLPGNLKYINLFMGTSGDNGQVSPGAAVPFGMLS